MQRNDCHWYLLWTIPVLDAQEVCPRIMEFDILPVPYYPLKFLIGVVGFNCHLHIS